MARFLEIAKLLQQNFRNGEYPEGKYPSLRKIAADMGCSYVTAVRAMHYLQKKAPVRQKQDFPLVAMISSMWNFSTWHRAIRESVMELGGQLRFVTYSSFIDPVITETLNEKFDLIILDCPVKPKSPLFKVVQKNKDRAILLFQDLTKYGIRCMDGCPEETVLMIMKELARHGIRKIDMIGRALPGTDSVRRKIWERGLRLIRGKGKYFNYPHENFNEESAECYHYLKTVLDAKKLPEAFFCISPASAQGLYRYLYDHGIVPGKDISVFSFGSEYIAEMMSPPLAIVVNAGLKDMVKSVISEYAEHRISDKLMFRLSRKAYYTGNSLVPFFRNNGNSFSMEENIRYSED